jgi:glycosyltransferase involved in cell wall biosynthesis
MMNLSSNKECLEQEQDNKKGISVIIMAYNRKDYIKTAINSVAYQKHNGFDVEIIVITNFHDENLTIQCNMVGAKYIVLQDGGMGMYLHYGISIAKFDIISFLDDDDYFLQGKLNEIFAIFSSDLEVGYLHNRFTSYGIFHRNSYSSWCSTMNIKKSKEIRILMSNGNWENLSSVTIRRTKYTNYIQALPRLLTIPDLFFAITALDGNIKTVTYNKFLTSYIFHESDSHIFRNDNLCSRKIVALERYISSMEVIISILKDRETILYMYGSLAHLVYLKNSLEGRLKNGIELKTLLYSFLGIKYSGMKGVVDIFQMVLFLLFPSYMRARSTSYILKTAPVENA